MTPTDTAREIVEGWEAGRFWRMEHAEREQLLRAIATALEAKDAARDGDLQAILRECEGALRGVIAVADRRTIEFDKARDLIPRIQQATGRTPPR